MDMKTFRLRVFACVAGLALLAFSGWASADPPSRVARLGYMSGTVSFSPAGESDWDRATLNRPMGSGDRLWTDRAARAEIQVGAALIRMDGETSVAVLNLDDRIAQLQLTQGTLNVRVQRLAPGQSVEVDTPNLAFTLRQPGDYRIAVDPDGQATDIIVRRGQGEAHGDGAAYVIDASQPYRFTGTGLREYEYLPVPPLDEFDRWTRSRDRVYDSSRSARYVAPDVIGYQDLDENGTWRVEPDYGDVWIPSRVASGWAPYRDGHWAWIDPWGWTWIDDAPWGFAVTHYGRWAYMRGTWGWIPGPVRAPAYYAPALVVFISGSNFQLSISSGSVGGIAWFPLAPREIYRPSYPVSRTYFDRINRGNTVVNSTVINNTYNSYNTTNITNVVYVNRAVPGAVVAVPTTAFVQSQPVARAVVLVSREQLARAPAAHVALVAPTEQSVRGVAPSGGKPPPRVFERPVVAHSAPAAPHVGLAAQREQLTAKPGRPLDDAARKALPAPARVAPAPVVKLVAPTPVVKLAPPAPAPAPAPAPSAPAQRAVEPIPVPPPQSAPAPAAPPAVPKAVVPPPRDVPASQPRAVPVPPPVRQVPPPPKPEPAPAARPAETRPPVALPKPPPPPLPVPAQVAPKAEPRVNGPRPAASKPRSAVSRALEREQERRRAQEGRQPSR